MKRAEANPVGANLLEPDEITDQTNEIGGRPDLIDLLPRDAHGRNLPREPDAGARGHQDLRAAFLAGTFLAGTFLAGVFGAFLAAAFLAGVFLRTRGPCSSTACAAARRATGTRNGEQLT